VIPGFLLLQFRVILGCLWLTHKLCLPQLRFILNKILKLLEKSRGLCGTILAKDSENLCVNAFNNVGKLDCAVVQAFDEFIAANYGPRGMQI
ncbi:hypothetical protein DL93DRAFT_2078230, partial [Clavulina sp. PMI_390]